MGENASELDILAITPADLDLAETLLTGSDPEAVLACSMLRAHVPESSLVLLFELRELVRSLPEAPFVACRSLALLEIHCDYEATGRSYRRLFESGHGVFGVEFVGTGELCEAIVAHTSTSKFTLSGEPTKHLDHAMLMLFCHHRILLDEVREAMRVLGYILHPTDYESTDEFVAMHGSSAACETLRGFF